MTDLQTLKDMFAKSDTTFTECTILESTSGLSVPTKYSILVEGGYFGFYTKFTFNLSGDLVFVGAYE